MAFIQIDKRTALTIQAGEWQEVYFMSFDKEGVHESLVESLEELENAPDDWTLAIEGALLETYETEE